MREIGPARMRGTPAYCPVSSRRSVRPCRPAPVPLVRSLLSVLTVFYHTCEDGAARRFSSDTSYIHGFWKGFLNRVARSVEAIVPLLARAAPRGFHVQSVPIFPERCTRRQRADVRLGWLRCSRSQLAAASTTAARRPAASVSPVKSRSAAGKRRSRSLLSRNRRGRIRRRTIPGRQCRNSGEERSFTAWCQRRHRDEHDHRQRYHGCRDGNQPERIWRHIGVRNNRVADRAALQFCVRHAQLSAGHAGHRDRVPFTNPLRPGTTSRRIAGLC